MTHTPSPLLTAPETCLPRPSAEPQTTYLLLCVCERESKKDSFIKDPPHHMHVCMESIVADLYTDNSTKHDRECGML